MSAFRHLDGSRYELFAGVVMHNHVHVLFKPLEKYLLQKSFILGNLSLPISFGKISGGRLRFGKMSILTALSGMSRTCGKGAIYRQ